MRKAWRCGMRAGWLRLAWLWLIAALPGVTRAEIVELRMPGGVPATAEWLPGEADGEAVLVLHGFLQTRDFPTVRRLGEALNEAGHSVLLPTLSLGVPRRRESLQCEALHLHDLEGDVAELLRWVNWLHRRTRRPVTLIGHSAGGHVVSRLLALHPDAPLARVVLLSIAPQRGAPPAGGEVAGRPGDFRLGYCARYPSTPEAFHSYVDWTPERMLAAMAGARVPVVVIVGSRDRRLQADWIGMMREGGIDLRVIEGANHFFDSAHEFDLHERVERLLEEE